VKGERASPYFKLISDCKVFDELKISAASLIEYQPDHNLDEDSWFKVEQLSTKEFFIDLLTSKFDSKDYANLDKKKFSKIDYIFETHGDDFYFQKISPSYFLHRKTIVLGDVAEVEESQTRIVINALPDAIYVKRSDTLIFKNLATISSIFKGIDTLFKEATNDEVEVFLSEKFICLKSDYGVELVSKPNRKRIGLALETLGQMAPQDRAAMLPYINEYCGDKLKFDKNSESFEISTDDELKLLVYGIEQRFYTTLIGKERRLANSVQALN
jgi:hypothetical protein